MSPDGRWLAYVSDESRRYQVYIRPTNGNPVRVQVSVDGGSEPVWARNGRQLYYLRTSAEADLMVATLAFSGNELRVIEREPLFSWAGYETAEPHPNFDVDLNDEGFVMVRRTQAAHLVLIQNVHRLVHRDGN